MAAVAVLAGCTSPKASLERGPANAAFEDVKNEDLSAHYPERVKQPTGGIQRDGAAPRPQLYPAANGGVTMPNPAASRAASPGVTRTGEGYQLVFDNAGIADVAKAIFTDTLQVPFVMDPRVQGQMSLSTGRAVTREELLKCFEAALRLSNAVLLADAKGYRIVPAGEVAAGEVGRLTPVRPGEAVPAGYGVSVMPLRNTSAEAMLRLIEGFLSRAGALRAEQVGNLLIIRGGARERENIIDVITTFDVDWLKGQSAGIFPLSHATPDDVITELNQVLQNEQGKLGGNMVRFQAITRLNAILVLTRSQATLRTVAEWVRRLDKASTAGQNVYVYQVENGKAADIAALLNDTFGGSGSSSRRTTKSEVAPGRNLSQTSSAGNSGFGQASNRGSNGSPQFGGSAGGASAGPPGLAAQESATSSPAGVSSSSTGSSLGGGNGGQGGIDVRIIADEANNALLIRGSQNDYQKVVAALRQIDKPPLQVLINATIAEVTLTDALKYGVQAYLLGRGNTSGGYLPSGSTNTTTTTGTSGTSTTNTGLTIKPGMPAFNLIFGNIADPRVVLDALSDVTTVKVVSSPSVVVVDNQPATLKVGDQVPITTQQSQGTENSTSPVINSIQYRETGVILKVTPRVNSSGLVTMDVDQEISQVAANAATTTTSGSTQSPTPTISQRRIASTVSVYSGQTVTLGGLISEQQSREKKSVPGLNSIPILGDLLGHTEKTNTRTELIVFIKPQIIRNGEDASRVSEELRSKLRSMAFDQEPGVDARREEWTGRGHGMKDAAVK